MKNNAYIIKNTILENPNKDYKELFKDFKKEFAIITLDGVILFNNFQENSSLSSSYYNGNLDNEKHLLYREEEYFEKEDTKEKLISFILSLNHNKIIMVSIPSNIAFKHITISTYTHIILFLLLNLFALTSYRFYLNRHLFTKVDQIKEMLEEGSEIKDPGIQKDLWLSKFYEVVKEWQSNNLKNIEKLKLEKIKLNNIISSVDMGILLFNNNKEIKLKNNAINFIYVKEDVKNYSKDIKYPEIIEFIGNLIKEKEESTQEVYLKDIKKYILLNGKYMKKRKEYLLTIKDITRNKETLEIQKKFITNIGHELKTPLTNVTGYLIALKVEVTSEKSKKFIEIIERNSKKLDNILMDFLNLSKIESNKIVNLSLIKKEDLVLELNKSLDTLIQSKKATLNFKFDTTREVIRVDFEKTNMIIKNLVENAIIYNNNIPKIDILFSEKFDKYIVSVKDNGIGIKKSDTYKIFDRFYRVDQARTSNTGGTGLGLSIVYELVQLCGGTVDVISNSEGTNFTFSMIK